MIQVLRTAAFDDWLQALRDKVGQRQVLARLTRLSLGNWRDCKPVGGEVTELRIDSGPGYRVYCWRDGDVVVVALGGGDKSTQQKDIAKAQAMVKELKG
jgi:putative addiction module killer protein